MPEVYNWQLGRKMLYPYEERPAPAVAPGELYARVVERRFKGVNRCC